MKDAIKIFRRDIESIYKNYAAFIVVIALCILPSLYAWFNIKASWDPYSQEATHELKVAVVNNDIGATLNGENVNLGQEIIDNLKNNKQMGWQFVTEEEANKMIKEGKYYASITIPQNFSKDLTSIVTENIKKGDIIYTVNEKINAIAPKLTDKGATGVQQQITKEIVKVVSDTIFGAGNKIGVELENQIPKISSIYNGLVEVQNQFDNINETVNTASEGAQKIKDLIKDIQSEIPKIKDTLKNAQALAESIKNYLLKSKEAINNIAPIIKKDIEILNSVAQDIEKYTQGVIDAINSGTEKAPEMIQSLLQKVSSVDNTTESLINILNTINRFSPSKPLTGIIDNLKSVSLGISKLITTLNDINDRVSNGETVDLSKLNNLLQLSQDLSSITESIYNNFDDAIVSKINGILEETYSVTDNTLSILKEAESKIPDVISILDISYDTADKGINGIEFVKKSLPKAESAVNELVNKLGNIQDNADLQQMIDLLKTDVQKRSDFLTTPVNIIENRLFPMGNYGTGMAPFYTVLALWVGLLLLTSIFTVEVEGEFKAYSKYFGKLMLFLTITIIQGLIVSLGDLYILKIYCVNPILFVLGSIFTSIVFTFIVYSLVSVFGNIGKVISIILLVLQVAGSGGTFPIQLTPKFFQVLYPFLPFTYAISFARESIGGVVESVLIGDVVILIIYIVIFLVISIFLKGPINKASRGFIESLKKSKLGE